MAASEHLQPQQFFFHGTRHTFKPGQILDGGVHPSNQGYGQPGEHVYFSEHQHVAGFFAEAGSGPKRNPNAKPRVYEVEPIDHPEVDPDEEPHAKSYRSRQVRVVRSMSRASWGI